jgi:hypothetical protein
MIVIRFGSYFKIVQLLNRNRILLSAISISLAIFVLDEHKPSAPMT